MVSRNDSLKWKKQQENVKINNREIFILCNRSEENLIFNSQFFFQSVTADI
jgi:hypothetical protein